MRFKPGKPEVIFIMMVSLSADARPTSKPLFIISMVLASAADSFSSIVYDGDEYIPLVEWMTGDAIDPLELTLSDKDTIDKAIREWVSPPTRGVRGVSAFDNRRQEGYRPGD